MFHLKLFAENFDAEMRAFRSSLTAASGENKGYYCVDLTEEQKTTLDKILTRFLSMNSEEKELALNTVDVDGYTYAQTLSFLAERYSWVNEKINAALPQLANYKVSLYRNNQGTLLVITLISSLSLLLTFAFLLKRKKAK